MSERTDQLLFSYQNNFFDLSIEISFNFFMEFLRKIKTVTANELFDYLAIDYNEEADIKVFELYEKKDLLNLIKIKTNNFMLIYLIFFLYYLSKTERLKNRFVEKINTDFFKELYHLLFYIEKNADFENNNILIFFTKEISEKSIAILIDGIDSFLREDSQIPLNNFRTIINSLKFFNFLFKEYLFSIEEISEIFTVFSKEWNNIFPNFIFFPEDDYDINEEELKRFIRLYWTYFTLRNFRRHLKIFTTDYFYHKKSDDKRNSKAEEIGQSHYLLYLRQFLDKGNDEHLIIDHEKHFGNSRYDILINEIEQFPPIIIECKFITHSCSIATLTQWITQIETYISNYNTAFPTKQIKDGIIFVFNNNSCNFHSLNKLEEIENSFFKIKDKDNLYLFSISID